MKKNLLYFLLMVLFGASSFAQEQSKFGIKFTGFVKSDIYFDSRQTVSIRDGHFLLYPKNEVLDANGEDVNARPSFNIISIQTRLRGNITGPDAFGAKTSGAIEGEFFGHASGEINEFRLRHAYVKLDWTNTQVLVGQYWHPLFVTSCFPGTVSFNTGVPFQPFSRNPQIRFAQKFSNFKFMFTAIAQRDFTSTGPDGASTKYLRNSVVPALNLRFEYAAKYDNGNEVVFGLAGNYKALTPRLLTPKNYITHQKATSMLWLAYFKYVIPAATFKFGYTNGQDAYNMVMLGGYAVKDTVNKTTGEVAYTPYKTSALWGDVHTNGSVWQMGVFFGYTQNLGTVDAINGDVYSRGSNIDYVYRVSPRFIYNTGKFRIAPEVEYTVAAYAKTDAYGSVLPGSIDSKGVVMDSSTVANFRFLLGVYYFF